MGAKHRDQLGDGSNVVNMLRINVYKCGTTWYCARFRGDEFDCCEELLVDDHATESEAIAAAALSTEEPCEVTRVGDLI
jgi:hypothetical protein